MTTSSAQAKLPHPAWRLPVLGDVLRLDPSKPVQREMRMADDLGSVFEVKIVRDRLIVVAGADVAQEVFDESRFVKAVVAPLTKVRAIAKDGLFTAYNSEPNWARAHNILGPAFSQSAMRSYHETMVRCVDDLTRYWSALPGPVDIPSDMNKLTLEIIGRSGFGYEFGSFDSATDPFVDAMSGALFHLSSTSNDIPVLREILGWRAVRQFPKDVATLHSVVDDVIARRRSGPPANDLLQHLLETPDSESGELLTDENIRYQVLTFLIAGHETTAGTLAFALHYLSLDPKWIMRARNEIDEIWPDPTVPLAYEQVAKFRLIKRIVDETLRLWPSGPAFFRKAREDTTLAGKYAIEKGHPILVVLLALHRDKAVWGTDPDHFDPDRFLPSQIRARANHNSAYKPFGTGARSCIGRQFALHETVLTLVMLLRRFDFAPESGYELRVHESMTIKPEGLRLHVTERG
ncbi:cytochrome P450 [Actinomycetes bacterium M1A6_2h]